MASRSKAAYSERKRPKSTFILTVNRPYLSIIQGKENRLSHRPISSAKGTGGLNFLIAYAPLILCHSLFEVVIHNVLERGEIVLALVAVHAIGNGHQPHIMEREKFLGELAHLNVVPAQPGEVFHEHRRDVPGLDCGNHFLKAGALHGSAGDTVIHEKDRVRVTLVLGGLLENFLLERDLSRVFST